MKPIENLKAYLTADHGDCEHCLPTKPMREIKPDGAEIFFRWQCMRPRYRIYSPGFVGDEACSQKDWEACPLNPVG